MALDVESAAHVRPMLPEDVDAADRVMRIAFGTIRGLREPETAFGDAESIRTRHVAAPDCAWVAELDGEVVGSALAARWGSFGFLGPLTVHPDRWDRGIGSSLLQPVLEAFERWELRQAGLFTFADSPKHLGLYQKHGFWPGRLTVIGAKEVSRREPTAHESVSAEWESRRAAVLDEVRGLTNQVFGGLDVTREITSAVEQGIGDAVLRRSAEGVESVAVCHTGAGSEAGADTCYVKFAAVRPGRDAGERFERLLDACEAYAAASGLSRLVAGVDTGRLGAYRRLLGRGFRMQQIGVTMWLRPDEVRLDAPEHYVIDDLR